MGHGAPRCLSWKWTWGSDTGKEGHGQHVWLFPALGVPLSGYYKWSPLTLAQLLNHLHSFKNPVKGMSEGNQCREIPEDSALWSSPLRKPQKTRVPEGRDNRQQLLEGWSAWRESEAYLLPQTQLFRRPSDAGTTPTGTCIQPSTERVGSASSGNRCRGRDSSVTGATGKLRIQSTVPAMSQGRLLEPMSDRPVLERSGTSTPPKWLPVG